ncbi:ABC transporter permease [Janthinobacterium aquaticum]|uniref:polar amino acid ABC transporter permease n=1 Tax=Janthinobacterium sp. FT58W TaxID=2654254 RepID=UPI001264343B|nr:polar amino acid ABC transporter permease [Janthinobacterium sp. FT58W]KAB8044230.1 polar amino acid ABC transporter permease [Janthinobacterium sp. FT58W]
MNGETLDILATWTPFLLQGFMWNIVIAICAVSLGTCIGALLAWLRVAGSPKVSRGAARLSTFLGAVPTLALIFYVVFVLPSDITIPLLDVTITIPQWLKAVIGLASAPLSYTTESLVVAHRNWSRGNIDAVMLFIPSWINVFLISFGASSGASLVGVSELVSRCNTVIAATGTGMMVPVYLYCSLFFVLTSLLFTMLIRKFKHSQFMLRMHEKMTQAHALSVRAAP